MVDMHIHTSCSDGIDSVEEILKKAEKLGLSIISLTDHNSVEAYENIIKDDLLKLYKGKIITGAELKCHFSGDIIELLIYDFEIDKLKNFIEKNYINWEKINKDMSIKFSEILTDEDITYDKTLIHSHDFTKYNGVMEIYKTVLGYKENHEKLGIDFHKDITEFFRRAICCSSSKFYIDLTKYYPSAEDVFKLAKTNNYKVFIPHVYMFNNGFKMLNDINKKFKLDGLECYHPSYTLNQCDELVKYASENNLYISAGSDYHGFGYKLGQPSKYIDTNKIKLFEPKNIIKRK